jgi:hypothetical protein
VTSEDYSSVFQTSLSAPSTNEVKEQAKQDTRENFEVYLKDKVPEAPKEEVKSPQVLQQEFSVPTSSFSPRIKSWEPERSPKNQEPKTATPRDASRDSLKLEVRASSREAEEPAEEGVKVGPRDYSQEFQQSRVPISPRSSIQDIQAPVKEDDQEIFKDFQTQKPEILAKANANIVDEPPRQEVKPTPRVVSIDEVFKEILQPAKEAKLSKIEIKEKETSNGSQTTTEAEDTWTPPKSFKMKKSKKTFSTRY